MPLIFLPGQFQARADLYHQISTLVTAGFGLPQALQELRDNPPSRSFRRPLERILWHIREGHTFAESLRRSSTWLPEFDIALLEAGENSGRIDACLKLLAGYYAERARMARFVLGKLAYPVFLLHFALLIFAFVQFIVTWNVLALVLQTVGVLLPLYVLTFVFIYVMQGSRGRAMRVMMESLLNRIPLVGRARRHLSLARLAMSLESLLSAGVNIITAWELSARASGSTALDGEVSTWREQIEAGVRPSELVRASRHFPSVFGNLYNTGEVSGRLDEHLGRIHTYYQESGTNILRQVSDWVPRIAYLIIACWIGYKVVQFWVNYYNALLG